MKKFTVLLLLLFPFYVYAQQNSAIITGKIGIKDTNKIILCVTEEASWRNVDTCDVASDGTFSFEVKNPKSGIWSIVSATKARFVRPYYIKFYLSKNEKIDILVDKTWSDYSLTGKLSDENNLFYKWNKMYSEMFDVSQTYKELYPKVEGFVAKADKFKKEINTQNKEFNTLLENTITYDIDYGMIIFRASPNSIHPSFEEIHPFYAEIFNRQKFDNDNCIDYPGGVSLMSSVTMFKSMAQMMDLSEDLKKKISFFDLSINLIVSNKLKGIFFNDAVTNRYGTYEELMSDYNKYGKFLWSDYQKSNFENVKKLKQRFMIGQPAFNFTFPDVTGKMVSLSDFKGKVVLVDVWATWCGPCKQQIPSLKALEKELHGKDIIFIGVSIDNEDKKQEWLDMVKKEELGGVQLFAGKFSGSSICNDYEITGIPRFMIFDKKGNIYSINAPRPSEPKLKEILLDLIK